MGTIIYADATTGTAHISLDDSTIGDGNTVTVQVQGTPTQQAPTSEAELITAQATRTTTMGSVEGDLSVSQVAIGANMDYNVVHFDGARGVNKVETAPVVVLPDSWVAKFTIDKWTRLCYEQQKAVYEQEPWWFSIDQLLSSTVTPGYSTSTIEFPVLPFSTEVFAETRTGRPFHYIDTVRTNNMIEETQIVYRKKVGTSMTSGTPTGFDNWKNYFLVDAEDDPYEFTAEGSYQFACYPLMDSKQIPMSPTFNITTESLQDQKFWTLESVFKTAQDYAGTFGYAEVNQSFGESEKAAFVPVWKGSQLEIYYFLPLNSNVHEIVFEVDGVQRGTIDTTAQVVKQSKGVYKEGFVSLGSFTEKLYRKNPFVIVAKRYHLTKLTGGVGEGRSFVDQIDFLTEPGMVRSDEFSIETIPGETNTRGDGSFPLRLRGDFSLLYKPATIEEAFQVNLGVDSGWFQGVKQQRRVLRLRVSKIVKGIEIHIGNFILNPTATSGSEIDGLCNLSQNLRYIETGSDTSGNYLDFDYLPYAGPTGLLNSSVTDEHFYVFRVAEWTLGVEHGLLTDESIAWMIDPSPAGGTLASRYRYDSWDEEHPVRRWKWMSPVEPKDDSVSRCANESRSAQCHIVPVGSLTSTAQLELTYDGVSVHDDFGWGVIYSEALTNKGSNLLTWPYFSFRVNIGKFWSLGYRRAIVRAHLYRFVPQVGELGSMSTGGEEQPQAYLPPEPEMRLWETYTVAEFDEWSEVFDVRDFLSYQKAHYHEYEGLAKVPAEETTGENVISINPNELLVPDPSITITEEDWRMYVRMMQNIATQATLNVREKWSIRYDIVFIGDFVMSYQQVVNFQPIPLTPDGNGGLYTGQAVDGKNYVLFNYDEIEQPVDNTAFLPASSRLTTDLAGVWNVKYSDPEPEDTGTPGVCGYTGKTTTLDFPNGNGSSTDDVGAGGLSTDGTVQTESY